MSAEKLNSLLIPGISRIFKKNELTLGNVFATQVYIQISNFQILMITLREDLFHQLLSRYFLKIHILAIKYHGFFTIENPNKISIIFGVQKDDIRDNNYYSQKSMFFCEELLKEVTYINIWLKECLHVHYNSIRNQYLRLSLSEREKVDISNLKININVGMATSDATSGRDLHHMCMMKIGSEISASYGAYGGVPYLSKKLCSAAPQNSVMLCENTVTNNEWLFDFKETENIYVDIYGNTKAFLFSRIKSINDIFFINRFIRENLTEQEENHINDIHSNLYVGSVEYNELKNHGAPIKLSISEYEQFQGLWMGARVNGILVYLASKLLGFEYERRIALSIIAGWYYYLHCKDTHLTLTEKFDLISQIPAPYQRFDFIGILKELESKKMTSRDAILVKSTYEFERLFFSHNFNSTGTLKKDFSQIKSKIVQSTDHFTEELYSIILKILTE